MPQGLSARRRKKSENLALRYYVGEAQSTAGVCSYLGILRPFLMLITFCFSLGYCKRPYVHRAAQGTGREHFSGALAARNSEREVKTRCGEKMKQEKIVEFILFYFFFF